MKTFQLKDILRPHILSITPYSSARDEYKGSEGIFLDANENSLGSITAKPYNRYPDPYQRELKEKLAPIKGVRPGQIFLGNGSDEAIDLLMRATCTPGKDEVILLPPTYGMYEVSAAINDVLTVRVPLTPDFQINIPAVLEAIRPQSKLIFLCTPNNPTGNCFKISDIIQVLENFQGLVVIDEAYIDFATEPSFAHKLDQYPNLVVMQTFSKAWGLAALRLGMAFASEEIIAVLNKLKPPYNISGPTQDLANESITNLTLKEEMVNKIIEQRETLKAKLKTLPLVEYIYPSDANFLLVKVNNARAIYDYLVENRIIVRDRSKVVLCDGCLRITVGTEIENNQLLESLHNYK